MSDAVGVRLRSRWLGLVVFVLGLVLIDRLLGFALERVLDASTPRARALRLAVEAPERNYDGIVVLGSSRATHHFEPSEIAPRLGVEVVNFGVDGQGLVFTRLLGARVLRAARPPAAIVVQFDPGDFCKPTFDRAFVLAPLAGRDDLVRKTLGHDWRSRIKLTSSLYRFNSLGPSLALSTVLPTPDMGDGFVPLRGRIDPDAVVPPRDVCGADPLDPTLAALLVELLAEADAVGVRVAVTLGPRLRDFDGIPEAERRAITEARLVVERGGAVWLPLDESTEAGRFGPAYYRDASHLNEEGARRFSRLFASELAVRWPDLGRLGSRE